MTLSPAEIEEWKAMALTMTTSQMAADLGINPALVRKTMSKYGIDHPSIQAHREKREQIRRYYGKKGEPATIAQYLDLSFNALRMRVKRMNLPTGQTKLPLS